MKIKQKMCFCRNVHHSSSLIDEHFVPDKKTQLEGTRFDESRKNFN